MDGFWTASFRTPFGAGAGVAYFTQGRVFGGDGGYTYTGTFSTDDSKVTAQLRVAPFVGGAASVFGSVGREFELRIEGQVNGNRMAGRGTSPGFPGVSFDVTLTKVA